MLFNFKSFWNSEYKIVQHARAEELVKGLIAIGHPLHAAKNIVEAFQHQAFEDGEMEESFNNCGEDA